MDRMAIGRRFREMYADDDEGWPHLNEDGIDNKNSNSSALEIGLLGEIATDKGEIMRRFE